jgi:hypothetical protein
VNDTLLRIFGSSLTVYGYYMVLFQDVWTGVLVSLVGNLLSIPWFVRTRCWDVVLLLGITTSIEMTRLLS